jgi:hypothetical protein
MQPTFTIKTGTATLLTCPPTNTIPIGGTTQTFDMEIHNPANNRTHLKWLPLHLPDHP